MHNVGVFKNAGTAYPSESTEFTPVFYTLAKILWLYYVMGMLAPKTVEFFHSKTLVLLFGSI